MPAIQQKYALVGLINGVSVVSLADPSNPTEVGFADGPSSGWRDIKTWKGYAYAINETSDGLLVIDLNTLPDSISYTYWAPTIDEVGTLSTCHNIYIDEFGTAYLAGCNVNGGGVIFVDVDSDPGNPIYLGKADPRYSHDVYVRDEMMYSSDIFAGFFSIADVSDKTAAATVATQNTPFNFTHNAWLSDDSKTLFTTDERSNAPTASYDISDLDNIKKLDEFRPAATINTGVIPHNVHVLDDYLVISHYSDGVVIVDAARPSNLIQVGQYDTYPQPGAGFSGCWGAYPFLPSGLVLGSDRGNGLFVIQPNYVRAAYLEGIVREEGTNFLLSDVKVEINDPNVLTETTDLEGSFATGTASSGTYEVTFSKLGFFPKTIEVDLTNGELTELDVELKPTVRFFVRGLVVDSDQNPIPRAEVQIIGDEVSYDARSSSEGVFEVEEVFEGEYEIVIGAWGYRQKAVAYAANANQELTFELEVGYEDDFALDLGWSVESDAISGTWELGEPIGTGTPPNYINPEFDVDDDIGNQCYVTGNGGGDGGSDDLDDGTTVLISPVMDLTQYNEPILNYRCWLFMGGGNTPPNDTLKVKMTNGIDTVLIRTHRGSLSDWRNGSFAGFNLKEFMELTDNMRILFEITDLEDSGHLVEAGIDQFIITEGDMTSSIDETIAESTFSVYPNPFSDDLQLEIKDLNFTNARFEIYDVNARLLYQQQIKQTTTLVELPVNLPKGSYWIRLNVDGIYQAAQQLVKQ
ncbi:MAG: choice-of-anchor B family protein [Bacteroidota bacterium]